MYEPFLSCAPGHWDTCGALVGTGLGGGVGGGVGGVGRSKVMMMKSGEPGEAKNNNNTKITKNNKIKKMSHLRRFR